EVVWVVRLLVDLGRPGRDPLARDLGDRVAKLSVLLRDRVDVGQGGHTFVMLSACGERAGSRAPARRLQARGMPDDVAPGAVVQVSGGIRAPARTRSRRDVGAAEVRRVERSTGDDDPGVTRIGVDRDPVPGSRTP